MRIYRPFQVFSVSPKRSDALREVSDRRMVSAGSTRWNFKSRTVSSVYENKEALVECLEGMVSGSNTRWDYTTLNEASGLLRLLNDREFSFYLEFFHRVMPHVDILYASMQKRRTSANEIHTSLQQFIDVLQGIR